MAKSKLKNFTKEDFIKHKDKYQKRNIADAAKSYSIRNGINRNVSRHIPLIFDGLKPVFRRSLLVLYEMHNKKFHKVNKVAGNTMGEYHPHGDGSIEAALGGMGQYWNNNMLYIDTQGSFGNMKGQEPAAGRYIECRLSKFAYKCFFEDYKYASLDKKPTYTGEKKEPEYLPAKYPIGLVNPQFSSIGYGTSSNIAPYNFKEVLEATISLIDNPDTKIHLIPDFPTGCEVIADHNLAEVNRCGCGKVKVRSTINIDPKKNVIQIRSIPMQVSTSMIVKNISELVLSKKMPDDIVVTDFHDDTDPQNGVHLDIILSKKTNAEKALEYFLKKDVGLQKTYAVQLRYIYDYQDVEYSPKEYLLQWLDFRRDILQSMYNNKYVKLLEEEHMNNIKLFVFSEDNLKKTMAICKKAEDTEEAIEKLVKEYKQTGMTSLQAKTIQAMRFSDFNKKAYQGFIERKKELTEEIKETERILSDTTNVDEVIKKELLEGISMFPSPRRSKIIHDKKKVKDIPDTKFIVGTSNDGYIKKVDPKKYDYIGTLGNLVSRPVILLKVNNTKSILVFDSNGKVVKVPVHSIPESTPEEQGVEIERFFKTYGSVVSLMEEICESDVLKELELVMVTKNGYSKKISFKDLHKIKDIKSCINLEENDKLVTTFITTPNTKDDIIIYTNLGDGVRVKIQDIKLQSLLSRGGKLIKLMENEYVVGAHTIKQKDKYLFCGTSSGKMKLTELKYFPSMQKNMESLPIISLSPNEYLVRVSSVTLQDKIKVYRKNNEAEFIETKDIPILMRAASGVKKVKCPKGDIVLRYTII